MKKVDLTVVAEKHPMSFERLKEHVFESTLGDEGITIGWLGNKSISLQWGIFHHFFSEPHIEDQPKLYLNFNVYDRSRETGPTDWKFQYGECAKDSSDEWESDNEIVNYTRNNLQDGKVELVMDAFERLEELLSEQIERASEVDADNDTDNE